MPSKTPKQHRFMAMCANPKSRKIKVAREFLAADKRKKRGKK